MKVYSVYYSSPIGILQVNGTEEAIHSINFVEEREKEKKKTPPLLYECKTQLEEYFGGKRKEFTVPIAQEGTEFQRLVWKNLTHIPFGKTSSYIDLARKVQDEKCVRAVGTANGKNTIPIIVPCHRVIGQDGKLVGYSGGLWRKQWLLEHEARHAHGILQLF